MADIERPQIKRLADNIRIMDDAAAGKGKYFIQPDTAREIHDDLKDLQGRIQRDREAEEKLRTELKAHFAGLTPSHRARVIDRWVSDVLYPSVAEDREPLRHKMEIGQWEGVKFTEMEEAPKPVTLQTMRDIVDHLKANNVKRPDGMVEIPAHPNSRAAEIAMAVALGTNGPNRVLSIRDDGRCQHIQCEEPSMPDGRIELIVHRGGWEYEAIRQRYADRIVTTGALEDRLRRSQMRFRPSKGMGY